MPPQVIRNNTDGVDTMLELLEVVDRNLKSDEKNDRLPEATRTAATGAREELKAVRLGLTAAREKIENMRQPKPSTGPKAIRAPERATVRR